MQMQEGHTEDINNTDKGKILYVEKDRGIE